METVICIEILNSLQIWYQNVLICLLLRCKTYQYWDMHTPIRQQSDSHQFNINSLPMTADLYRADEKSDHFAIWVEQTPHSYHYNNMEWSENPTTVTIPNAYLSICYLENFPPPMSGLISCGSLHILVIYHCHESLYHYLHALITLRNHRSLSCKIEIPQKMYQFLITPWRMLQIWIENSRIDTQSHVQTMHD